MPSASALLLVSLALQSQAPLPKIAAPPSPATTDLRCGAYCLYLSLGALDRKPSSFAELEKRLGQPTSLGYSMGQLGDAARSFGVSVLAVETSIENLEARPGRFACVALVERQGHFVCIYDIDESHVYLMDPPDRSSVSREVFSKIWKGKALLLSDRPITPMVPGRFPMKFAWIALVPIVAAGLWVQSRSRRRRKG